MADGFNPPHLWAPQGRAFSQGVIAPEGHTVHVSGQVAWDEHSMVVGARDVGAQMRQCVRNIVTILDQVGGRLDDIVSQTVYFLNRDDLPEIQRVRAERFPAVGAPASVLIQVPGLIIPEFLVELAPIAVIPPERFKRPDSAR